jgi:hypothetical protein
LIDLETFICLGFWRENCLVRSIEPFAVAKLTLPQSPRGFRMPFSIRLALATALVATMAATHAAPITGQGTWESELHARDINGNAVALDSAGAAFFWNSRTNLTWLANMNANGTVTWGGATGWAGALTTGGFTDWRLPNIIDSGTAGCNFSYAGGTD